VPHFGAAARARAARAPGRDDLTGVHAAAGGGGLQGRLEGAVEPVDVLAPQGVHTGRGRHLGLPESLVGQQVPDSGDLGLVEQPGLDGDRPLHDQVPEFRGRDLLRVRPERVEVRVEPDAPQPALVEQGQAAAVSELEREPRPFRLARLGVATSRLAAREYLAVGGRDDDATPHAQVETQVGAGRG
jgi:hypothetical protein